MAVDERHRAHLDTAISRARAALDLRAALRELGLVTGAVTTEHVLDAVFSRFCIGT